MDPPPRSSAAAAGSASSAAYTAEIAESLRFEEEIQSLMRDNTLIHPSLDPAPPPPPPSSSSSAASSFTALLGLSPNQAVELLHDSIGGAASPAAAAVAAADPWPRLGLPLPRASPTFPSNAALVDRAARFSVFAAAAAAAAAADADSSSPASSSGDPSPRHNRADPPAAPPPPPRPSPAPKRKDPPASSAAAAADKSKAKAKTKRSGGGGGRSAEEDAGGVEKLPYVHVRARRGQATDSHSLAERARREKINARMKLLQELVPGCSKISGTALVLDEIINHVQSLQRQVEFLSMRLAAVNPRVDFGGLDSFLSAECGRMTGDNGNGNGNGKNGAEEEGPRAAWMQGASDGVRRPHHHHQQIWHVDLAHPHHAPSVWERGPGDAHGPHLFISPSSGVASPYAYDPSSASAAALQSNQLKTEL